jgi:hypothetical protein
MKFDLILSHLVLHHIGDLDALCRMMLVCLKPRDREGGVDGFRRLWAGGAAVSPGG